MQTRSQGGRSGRTTPPGATRSRVGAVGRPLLVLQGHASERSDDPSWCYKVTFPTTVQVLTSWISSVCEMEFININHHQHLLASWQLIKSSCDHKVTLSVIIILKIEDFPRQPVGAPIFKPWKRSKILGKWPPVTRKLAIFLWCCRFQCSQTCPI